IKTGEAIVRAGSPADFLSFFFGLLGALGALAVNQGEQMLDVRVNLGPRSYDIAVRSGPAAEFTPFVRQRTKGRRAFVVTDDNARRHAEPQAALLIADGFHVDLVALPPGEDQKSLASAARLYDALAAGRA